MTTHRTFTGAPLWAAPISTLCARSHLWHGVASGFQSLGVDHPRFTPRLIVAGKVLAVLIAGGFIVIAAWVYLSQAGARA